MTQGELDELLSDCPTLYHMAASGSWPAIRERGLLSTTTLLDLYELSGDRRAAIEERRRPESVTIVHDGLPPAVVRDQIPMTDEGLVRALPANLAPKDWYRVLNQKVFFWLTRDRLLRMLNADAYRTKAHDVIELDARSLVSHHYDAIWLCPMNSGSTKPFPHPRDMQTFQRIADYPYASWRQKRKRGERVVELAVDRGVPNIAAFVTRVVSMRTDNVLAVMFQKQE